MLNKEWTSFEVCERLYGSARRLMPETLSLVDAILSRRLCGPKGVLVFFALSSICLLRDEGSKLGSRERLPYDYGLDDDVPFPHSSRLVRRCQALLVDERVSFNTIQRLRHGHPTSSLRLELDLRWPRNASGTQIFRPPRIPVSTIQTGTSDLTGHHAAHGL